MIFFSFCVHISYAQKIEIDSLQVVLNDLVRKTAFEKDTNYINARNELAKIYQYIKPDTTLSLAKENLAMSEKIGHEKGKIDAIINIGIAYNAKGEVQQAMLHYQKGLAIAQKIGYKKEISTFYNSIANTYNKQGKYPEALENYLKSIKIGEEIGNRKGVGTSLNNIAIIYANQEKDSLALIYYNKALTIRKAMNDMPNVAKTLQGIGIVYFKMGKFENALEHHLQSMVIREKIKDNQGIAFSAISIGDVYAEMKENQKAINYLEKANDAYQNLKDAYSRAWVLQGMGRIYNSVKEYDKSIRYAKEALKMSQEAHYTEFCRDNSGILSLSFEAISNYKESLFYYKLFNTYDDSVNNIAVEEKIAKLAASYEYDKKEAHMKEEHAKQSRQQKLVILFGTSILGIVLVFVILLWISHKKLARANSVLNLQKQEIDAFNQHLEEKIKERTHTLELANKKLQQYSFSNSHHVRRPVATILGLVALFNMQDANDPSNLTILEMLLKSTKELDDIIREINRNLQMPDANNSKIES